MMKNVKIQEKSELQPIKKLLHMIVHIYKGYKMGKTKKIFCLKNFKISIFENFDHYKKIAKPLSRGKTIHRLIAQHVGSMMVYALYPQTEYLAILK